MKIVQVTPRYAPHVGGVETHVQQISERLVERGHDVTVFTADAERNVERRETRNGVDMHRFRGVAREGAFHIAPHIATAVRRAEADIVHAHNYHSLPLFFAGLGITDQRFFVTPHYHGASASSIRNVLLALYRPFGRWAIQQADEVIAVSDWEGARLQEDLGVDATVIPNGIDIERFADAEPEKRDRPYLLYVGRLEEYKGVQHVIRALPKLPDYDLLVAGSGPYRDELAKIARDVAVNHRVEFLGYVDANRLPALYAGASVYVTLSEFEAYGMTVGEALAAGTPCVVRVAAALSDWTTADGVVLVEEPAPSTVARAVERAVCRQPGGQNVVSWDEVVDDLVRTYRGDGNENKHITVGGK